MNIFSKFSQKISLKILGTLLITLVVFITLTVVFLSYTLEKNIEKDTKNSLIQTTHIVKNMVETYYRENISSLNIGASMLKSLINSSRIDTNQLIPIKGIDTPALYINGQIQNANFTFLDKFKKDTTFVATFFVKIDDDFVRASTSLRSKDGKRLYGTYLNKKSPAYTKLINKQKYLGEAVIFGNTYLTSYEPLFDEKRKLIGALFVGKKANFDKLREVIYNTKILKSGYFWAINTKTKKFDLHPSLEGKDYTNIPHAKIAQDKKNGFTIGEFHGKKLLVVFEEFKPFSWRVVASVPQSEYIKTIEDIKSLLIIGSIVFLILLVVIMGFLLKLLILNPVNDLKMNMSDIAYGEGDLTKRLKVNTKDELGQTSKL